MIVNLLSSSLYAPGADTQLQSRRILLFFLYFPLHMQNLIVINAVQDVKHSAYLHLHSYMQWQVFN